MPACVLFGVEIRDLARYQRFMSQVRPALPRVGARYLAREAAQKVGYGECSPARRVSLEA